MERLQELAKEGIPVFLARDLCDGYYGGLLFSYVLMYLKWI